MERHALDGLKTMANLTMAINTRPSYHGDRNDKRVCHAKPGECRGNKNHYASMGLSDDKSWTLPIATVDCDDDCPYLLLRD